MNFAGNRFCASALLIDLREQDRLIGCATNEQLALLCEMTGLNFEWLETNRLREWPLRPFFAIFAVKSFCRRPTVQKPET
jgi:hypothetical protein